MIKNEIKAKVFAQYLGQSFIDVDGDLHLMLSIGLDEMCLLSKNNDFGRCAINDNDLKLLLKPLSAISDEDAKQLIQILFNDDEDEISAEEIDIDIHLGDGGNMVDADMILVIEIICRCFEGQFCIRECGSFYLYDEEGKLQPLRNTLLGTQYLLSKGYDLPQHLLDNKTLHQAKLAIYESDKTN